MTDADMTEIQFKEFEMDNKSQTPKTHWYEKYVQPCVAELVGTALFVFAGCVSVIENGDTTGRLQPALAHGLALGLTIAILGGISGGHFNPAVSLGAWIIGGLNLILVIPYWISQLCGGMIGAALAKAITLGSVYNASTGAAFTTVTRDSELPRAIGAEIIMTFFLVMAVCMGAINKQTSTPLAPFCIGFTVTVDILAGGAISGACMNPARAFGPAVVANYWDYHWLYWVGPMVGGLLVGGIIRLFNGGRRSVELLRPREPGRAEKTEVLNEDLLQIERRLDLVRMVCHNSHKKLLGCLQGQPGTDTDKRYKKLPLMGVSQSMQEGCFQLSDETLLGKTLSSCGEAEQRLAQELSQHEIQIEKDILEPLNQLTEVDIPNIQKQRKQLAKLVLDWDSARTRYHQAQKSLGTNFQMQPGKLDSLKEEVDEAANKVEQCKDQLAADLYNFVSKEGEYGQYFVALLEAQADYHRKALSVLEKALPEIQAQQDKWTEKPAFGTALEEHLKRSGREIALPLEACVMMLLETGMKEEGLFRIAAGASKLKKLKAALDCSSSQLDEFYSDPHAVAGALKSYLRELPEPLMTFNLYDEWIKAGTMLDHDSKMQSLWCICQKLPKPNLENFRYLVKFLAKLSHSSDINKMTPSNIAIVLGPNLLWAKHEGTLAEMAAATSVHVVTIIEPIIQHANYFFPDEIDFNVTGAFVPASANTNNVSFGSNDISYEFGIFERKRPVSMAVMDGDLLKKESMTMTMKVQDFHSKRGGTLTRKHASPAFQPPLPPTDGATPGDPHSTTLEVNNSVSASSTDPVTTHVTEEASTFKTKDLPTATTPPSLRNGTHQPSGGYANQMAVVPVPVTAPSPHSIRRATKKPAPAPPKPVIPPPGQPGNQGSPIPSNTPPSVSPKPATTTHNSSPPASTTNQGSTAAPIAYGSLPRRHSGSQPLIHAPSHPPPQPPTQPAAAPLSKSVVPAVEPPTEQSPSPPHSPSPPDTPPLGMEQSASQLPAQEGTQTQPPWTGSGTLPRPRPVPKPRVRPTVPPPPQPPSSHPASETQSQSASKIITDV
ncbi:rho GTPase-activating 17 isoform X1 [Pelobates cultripes]|uniref:Aquaporin-8 n=2 Tax=Pelobates cultripes TaxID=61616 RepID=A0AAD1SQG0_PELCU|nr:rho GTPase-activating 17 isoform X1 [Pelobates cultripes]